MIAKTSTVFLDQRSNKKRQEAAKRGRNHALNRAQGTKLEPIYFPLPGDKETLALKLPSVKERTKERIIFEMMLRSIETRSVITVDQVIREIRKQLNDPGQYRNSFYLLRHANEILRDTPLRLKSLDDSCDSELLLHRVPPHLFKRLKYNDKREATSKVDPYRGSHPKNREINRFIAYCNSEPDAPKREDMAGITAHLSICEKCNDRWDKLRGMRSG